MKVLGLMTCFNRKNKTVAAIRKLIDGNPDIVFDFIVVDDNSSDGTREELVKFKNTKVLHGSGSLFYTGGMRLAIQNALSINQDYDYCLLFNDDVEFFDSAIEKLTQREANCIWVGPTCDNNKQLSYGGVVKKSKVLPRFKIIKACSFEGEFCDTFNANCVLIPWSIFVELGNMDQRYSHSLGDFDYGFSARRKGFIIKVSDEFVGVCCDNPIQGGWKDTTLPRMRRMKLKESPKGLPRAEWFYYLHKNYNFITAIVYSIIPYFRIIIKK